METKVSPYLLLYYYYYDYNIMNASSKCGKHYTTLSLLLLILYFIEKTWMASARIVHTHYNYYNVFLLSF